MRVMLIDGQPVEQVVEIRHSGTTGFVEMKVDDLLVEMTPKQAAGLAVNLMRRVGECAERSAAELERWVRSG